MTTENSRADALTDEQRIGLEKAMAWCPHGSSEANTIRELLAASPVEQPAAAPIDDEQRIEAMARAMNVATDGHDRYWTGYVRSATAALRALRKLHPAPSPVDERIVRLEASVQRYRNMVDDLKQRLHDVTHPDAPTDEVILNVARAASTNETENPQCP
ncbi:gp63 [Burkholderia phage BcepB1A]|uniref:gp63 n=1 Tax=Burkholderia phage BcepB1A TaxID=279530 RepID=UPI00003779AF|nr:gp63 [Burkholderia phage BcepB1A]AAT37756.1 gp63 [Burkholderia phage BcepB1A]